MQYELNRIDYNVIVYVVDQYDVAVSYEPVIYMATFPTKEKAEEHLKEITVPHKYVDRLVYKHAKHEFHRCKIVQRKVVVNTGNYVFMEMSK